MAKSEKLPAPDARTLDDLFRLVQKRKRANPDESWTARLYARGLEKIAQKTGEEAVEVVIAAVGGSKKEIREESADLLYHLTVLWAATGVKPAEVWRVLERREGLSGLAEKADRKE